MIARLLSLSTLLAAVAGLASAEPHSVAALRVLDGATGAATATATATATTASRVYAAQPGAVAATTRTARTARPAAPDLLADGADARMLDGAEAAPWKGVGRVNVATIDRRAMCTGTLVAPDLVLTAAHCVIDPRTGATFAPGNVHFTAGWLKGELVAHRRAAAIAVHPAYAGAKGVGALSRDLALIRLDRPISAAAWFATGSRPREADALTLISYRRDRAHAPTRQDRCSVEGERGGVVALACAVVEGVSGSPVFAIEDGLVRLVGIVAAGGLLDGREVAYAVALGDALDTMAASLR